MLYKNNRRTNNKPNKPNKSSSNKNTSRRVLLSIPALRVSHSRVYTSKETPPPHHTLPRAPSGIPRSAPYPPTVASPGFRLTTPQVPPRTRAPPPSPSFHGGGSVSRTDGGGRRYCCSLVAVCPVLRSVLRVLSFAALNSGFCVWLLRAASTRLLRTRRCAWCLHCVKSPLAHAPHVMNSLDREHRQH